MFEEEIVCGKFVIIYKVKYLKDNLLNIVVVKIMKGKDIFSCN